MKRQRALCSLPPRMRLDPAPSPAANLPRARLAVQHRGDLPFFFDGLAVFLIKVDRRNYDVRGVGDFLHASRLAVSDFAVRNAGRLRVLVIGIRPFVRSVRTRPDVRREFIDDRNRPGRIRSERRLQVARVESIDKLTNRSCWIASSSRPDSWHTETQCE